ncbi:metallophosphoesterase [Microbacterium sp. P04]|uniref:metallophosphoesterase n=1 Tax=Microbacterium sp. P04 TaxID=3366947 RepID=UPI0037451992
MHVPRSLPAVGIVVALLSTLAVAPAAVAAPAAAPPVIVTEIVGDTVGVDTYEYFEVRNTTGASIDLAAQGFTFAYSKVDSADRTGDTPLAAEPLVLAANETAVLWVSYTTTSLDSFAHTVDEFRAYHSVPATTQVVRVTGQAGIANDGERAIRVLQNNALVSWSYVPKGAMGADLAAQFRLPAEAADLGLDVLAADAPRSPGVVAPEALIRPVAEPEPQPEPQPGAAKDWPLIVTEIAPDSVGDDNFEYFEVHNPTSEAIDLAGDGFSFSYIYVDTDDRAKDIALTVAEPTTIGAGETVVFWVSYASGKVDSFAKTVDEFRAQSATPAETRVVRVTGQAGMANTGPRGIRVLQNNAIVSWSTYARTATAAGQSAHFRLPGDVNDRGLEILAEPAAPSPGVVAPEALEGLAFDPQPDPTVVTAPLQVTEVLPDSKINLGGSDAFEFIEVYNANSTPIDFSDYSINYLYPDTSTATLWPAVPANVVIPGGETLVFWIKNGGNAALGEAEFNAAFGSSLTMGKNLVEITSAGMANGSARGVEVITNTGHSVSRSYYNMNLPTDDVQPDLGIRYIAGAEDPSLAEIVDLAPATPGVVQEDQVPAGLQIVPADTIAPTITDRTPTAIDPAADFLISFAIADNVDARTATMTLRNDVDATPLTLNLTDSGDGTYTYEVPAVDLIGKSWYEYSVVVSDGTNDTSLATTRVGVTGVDTSPVRLNVTDGQFVSGSTDIIAGGENYPSTVELSIGDDTVDTAPSLERAPVFAFQVSGVNFYFKNGVLVGDGPRAERDVLRIFDNTITSWETLSTAVPLEYTKQGDELVVSVWAGTKKAPEIDLGENNDDFDIRTLRLVLPDGRTLTPTGYDDPSRVLGMGDSVNASNGSTGKYDYFDARFTLPDDAFSAVTHVWDTTKTQDGPVRVRAIDGTQTATRTVTVDNTAPVISSTIVDGSEYQGQIDINATVVDAGSGVADGSMVATLDGAAITLPYTTSSVTLPAGQHELSITATDKVGNVATSKAVFTTFEEQPTGTILAPAEGAEVEAGNVTLQAQVTDPTDDKLDVSFLEGRRLDLADGEVATSAGTVNDALDVQRDQPTTISSEQLQQLAAVDGVSTDVSSDEEFPYQVFDLNTGDITPGSQVRATWSGRANADATVLLYAMRADGSGWDEVTRHVATADDEQFTLTGVIDAATYAVDGKVRMLVQHSEGFAGENLSNRDTAVTPHNAEDVARSDYDFTFGWESDTQYYNENTMPGDPFKHQKAIHSYLLDQRDELNLQYLFHTGDIVDDWDQEYQWKDNADPQYQRLDDADLPYGVLAGNHDVGHELEDYSAYSTWFGEDRFADNPWYGGSYEDNRGHYDLISAGGIDFIMVYQGWGPDDAEIAWMNEVLAQYPDRVAIIAQHEFILTTGGLGEIPQRILDEVVATNPNVKMVFSGHYHDALTRTDSFDDNGDGVNDRDVFSLLFDYQGLPEGGLGYLRLLHFDNEGERMMVRTYSPSLDVYNSDDLNLLAEGPDPYANQEFELTYDQLGIEPGVRTLGTDAFTAEILTTSEIAAFPQVNSPAVLTATWPLAELGDRGWYVKTTDPYDAVDYSPVSMFSVIAAAEPGTGGPGSGGPGSGGPGSGGPGSGEPGTGTPGDPGSDVPGTGDDGEGDPDAAGRPAGGADSDLATTGGEFTAVVPWVFGAAGLTLLGALLVLMRRRRAQNS